MTGFFLGVGITLVAFLAGGYIVDKLFGPAGKDD